MPIPKVLNTDIELQDHITAEIVQALSLQLTPRDRKKTGVIGTENTVAYDAYLEGLKHLSERRLFDADPLLKARVAFEKAIAIDPEYSTAMAGLACVSR